MAARSRYRIVFHNQGQVYEIYAKSVSHGSMLGFVEVEGLLFGERTQVVVDPSEERLRTEFKGVTRFFVPMHAVVRIDEVEKEGASRITEAGKGEGTLMPFPSPVFTKPGGDPVK